MVNLMENKGELKKRIIEVLETIMDPEIGIDVYNLGMIRDIIIVDEKTVKIKMTLTTAFCPLANILPMIIKERLMKDLGLENVEVELVFDKPWTPLMITEKGRKMFKEKYGYDIVEDWKRRYGG